MRAAFIPVASGWASLRKDYMGRPPGKKRNWDNRKPRQLPLQQAVRLRKIGEPLKEAQ